MCTLISGPYQRLFSSRICADQNPLHVTSLDQPRPISFPESSFPLTSGRKKRALGATISGMRYRCTLIRTEFGYFLCSFKMVAPRVSPFPPLVKGNEDSGNRIEPRPKAIRDFGGLIRVQISQRRKYLGTGLRSEQCTNQVNQETACYQPLQIYHFCTVKKQGTGNSPT